MISNFFVAIFYIGVMLGVLTPVFFPWEGVIIYWLALFAFGGLVEACGGDLQAEHYKGDLKDKPKG